MPPSPAFPDFACNIITYTQRIESRPAKFYLTYRATKLTSNAPPCVNFSQNPLTHPIQKQTWCMAHGSISNPSSNPRPRQSGVRLPVFALPLSEGHFLNQLILLYATIDIARARPRLTLLAQHDEHLPQDRLCAGLNAKETPMRRRRILSRGSHRDAPPRKARARPRTWEHRTEDATSASPRLRKNQEAEHSRRGSVHRYHPVAETQGLDLAAGGDRYTVLVLQQGKLRAWFMKRHRFYGAITRGSCVKKGEYTPGPKLKWGVSNLKREGPCRRAWHGSRHRMWCMGQGGKMLALNIQISIQRWGKGHDAYRVTSSTSEEIEL
ncbi:hypothetical protein C8R44DRAFT_856743 [Mycena epipterygia]|nr:hypothetical protein C8R44DRAFT_856743 [Mycena epipterygia]